MTDPVAPRAIVCTTCKGAGMVSKHGYMSVTSEKCGVCNGIGRLAQHADGTVLGIGTAHVVTP